jgi:hypothetical protein
MSSFKQKNPKVSKICKTKYTLDDAHRELIKEFKKQENEILPELDSSRKQLYSELETEADIENKLSIHDKIRSINQEIHSIKQYKKQYLLENSKYIFEYFEHKKNISKATVPTVTNKNKLVQSFFKINVNPTPEPDVTSNLLYKYFRNIDSSMINMDSFVYPTDVCRVCNDGELIPYEDEGILICTKCAASIPYLIENEKPTYKEPPKEVCFYAYKRINHFKEIISQFQGKETTHIPTEVTDRIVMQIKKERITVADLTNDKLKEILKKLGYSKYYEHCHYIKYKLGIPPPIMSSKLEETLFSLFTEIQKPYSKYCPDTRVNFLNYYYTAYKLCELLEETSYLSHFPRLKDPEKIIEQDAIWKNICNDKGWKFIRTV